MTENLLEDAKKEGMEKIIVEAMIEKEGKVLLIEPLGGGETFYTFPCMELQEGEAVSQVLQKVITLKTGMALKEVKRFLGHYDEGKIRHLHFVVEVSDPYSVKENSSIAHAWLEPQEAAGYPITDALRGMLDLYVKT
ncbi:MAG: hypothetical protein KDK63_01150 [Chlamydiia bacterium]|nr:hypothetical protein [Chlamydiia bacterium]